MSPRNIKQDVLWGLRRGLLLTAVVFIPAVIVVAQRPWSDFADNLSTYSKVLAYYFGFGAAGGAVIGLCRPVLTRRAAVALISALLGVCGFLLLMYAPDAGRQSPNWKVGVAAAVLGFFGGAWFGWWAWGVSKRYQESAD